MGGAGRGSRPTMTHVARSAGVAVSTVSRVVNGDPTVGAHYAALVRSAIDALGWEPDDRARQLRLGTSGTIGAAVGNLDSRFLRGAERAARAAGLMLLAASTEDDGSSEDGVVRSLCRRRVDGLVVEPSLGADTAYLAAQIARGLPVVAIDRPLAGIESDRVLGENERGVELAHAHLLAHGHRRIAFVGDDERLFTGRRRAETFRRCVRASGGDPEAVLTGVLTADRVSADLEVLLRIHPEITALVTGNAAITVLAMRHLGTGLAGLDLVGFDDLEFAAILDPPRTVVAQDPDAMGRAAVDLLTSRMADPTVAVREVVVPVALIDRSRPEPNGCGGPRRR